MYNIIESKEPHIITTAQITPSPLLSNPKTIPFIYYFCIFLRIIYSIQIQRKRGQWAVYYTSPQSFIITLSYLLALQL